VWLPASERLAVACPVVRPLHQPAGYARAVDFEGADCLRRPDVRHRVPSRFAKIFRRAAVHSK
jgi:hypothetical protein